MIKLKLANALTLINQSMKGINHWVSITPKNDVIERVERSVYNPNLTSDERKQRIRDEYNAIYKMLVSKHIRLDLDREVVVFLNIKDEQFCKSNSYGVYSEEYILRHVYPISYTLGTDNLLLMFCFVHRYWHTSKVFCINNGNNTVIRNDFKTTIENYKILRERDLKEGLTKIYKHVIL